MANQRFRFPCAGASSGYGMESYSTANFQPRYNMYNMRPRGPPPWLNPGPRWQPPLNRGPAPPAVRGRGQGHSHGQGWRSGANEGQSKDQEQLVEDKAEKEEEKEEEEEEEDDDDEGDDDWSHCAPCNKDFTDYAAFFRHLRGVSHQTNVDAYKKIKRQESVSKVKRQEPQSTGPKTPQKNTDATDISTATPCPSSATNDSKTAENKEQEMETDENKTTEIQQQEKKPNDSKTTEISKAAKTQEQEEQGDQGEEEDEEDDEDWSYCKPCDRHFQSLQNYTSHARGILHASNQLEYEKQQASTEAALSSRGPGCTQPRKPASVSSTYRCELCAIDFQSQSQLDQHYQSRLHVTKMMNQQVQRQSQEQGQEMSQLQGWDQSQGQSQLQGGDQSQGQSQLQGWDQSQGQSQLQGWDQSQGQSQLQGWDQSQGQSQLQGGDQSQGQSQLQGWDQSQGQSQLQGWDQGQGQSQLQGQSWDQSQGQSQMQWQSWDQSQGQSQHQSQQQSGQQKTETSDKTWEIVELPESFGAASMFACKVCDVCCTSELTLASHLNGQKHAKVLRKKKQAEALKSMKDGETPTIVGSVGSKKKLTRNQLFIQSELDKCDQPLIGLDYVIEYRKNDCTQEPRYVCGLCHSTADPRMIIIHVTGVKHRLRYMKYHWPRRYSSLRPIKKKSVVVEQCAEHAMEIQRWEGRQKPRLKLEIDPFAISAGAESTDNFADVYVEGAGPRRALPGTCEVQNVSGYQQEKASTSDDEDLGDLWTPEPADMYSQHQGPQDYDPPPPIPSSHPSRGHPSRGPIGPPPHPPPPPHYPHPRHRFPPSCGPMGPPPPRPPRPPRYPLPGHPFPPPQEPVGPPLPPPHPPSPPPPPPPHYPLPHDSFETLPPRDRGPVGAPPVPPRPVQVIDYGHQVNEPTHSVSQQSEPKQLESQQPVRESQLEGAVLAAVKLLSQQAAVAGANSPALAALMTSLTSQASAPAPGQNQPSAFAAALSELMRVQAERKKAETANQLSNVLTSAVMKSVKTTPPVTHQLTEQTLLVGQKTQHEPTASLQIPASPVVQRIQQLTNLSLTLEKASSVQPTSVGQVGNVQPNVQPTSFGQVGNVQPTLVGQVGNVQPNVQPTSVGQVGNVQPTLVGQVSILQPNIQPTSVGKASIVQPNVQPTSVVKVSNVQPFSAYRPVAAQPQPSQPPGSGLEGLLSQLKPDTMARISQLLDDIQTLKTTNKPGTSPAPASTKVVPIVASAQSFAAKPTSSARPNLLSTPQTGVMRTSQQKYTAVHSSTETYRQQSAASLSLNHQKVANIKRTLAAPIPQANIPQKPAAMGYQVAPKQSVSKQNIQSEQKLVNTKRTTAAPILYANITGTQKLPAIGHRVAQKQSVTKQDNVNSYKRKSSSDLRLAEVKRKTPAPAVGSAQVQQAVAKQASPVLDMFAPDTTSTKTVSGSSETKAAAAAPKQTVAAVAPKQTVAAAAPKQTVAATAPKQTVAAAAFKQKS